MKKTIIICALLLCNFLSAQEKDIKVLKIETTDFYYVYSSLDLHSNDTIILLGNKFTEKNYQKIVLKEQKEYVVKTRFNSLIKITEERNLHCIPSITFIDDIKISTKGSLPIFIISYSKKEI